MESAARRSLFFSSTAFALLAMLHFVSAELPSCSVDESLASLNGALYCAPVSCTAKYGLAYFNLTTHLCTIQVAPQPSNAPGGGGGTGSSNSSTSRDGGGGFLCVHGTIVCVSACTCRCDAGYLTATSGAGGPYSITYCNMSSGTMTSTPGQLSSTACTNAVQCFFIDQLPYALVSIVRMNRQRRCAPAATPPPRPL